VTVQTESEKQIDKLRRKEEKRNRRGIEHAGDGDLSTLDFSSLLQASERKNLVDGMIGSGDKSIAVNALPEGTIRKYRKGYEEVIIPPKPTAPMKPGERLVYLFTVICKMLSTI
jgi:activating signal cointegrator complex subunit 3